MYAWCGNFFINMLNFNPSCRTLNLHGHWLCTAKMSCFPSCQKSDSIKHTEKGFINIFLRQPQLLQELEARNLDFVMLPHFHLPLYKYYEKKKQESLRKSVDSKFNKGCLSTLCTRKDLSQFCFVFCLSFSSKYTLWCRLLFVQPMKFNVLGGVFTCKNHITEDNFLYVGAGLEHRGEGGGFLRANAAICVQWDRYMFSTCSLLHLPQPTDSASSPSQDRCCLNHCWTKCQRTQEEEGAPVQLLTAHICKWLTNVPDHSNRSGSCCLCHTRPGIPLGPKCNNNTFLFCESHNILQASTVGNKQLSQ